MSEGPILLSEDQQAIIMAAVNNAKAEIAHWLNVASAKQSEIESLRSRLVHVTAQRDRAIKLLGRVIAARRKSVECDDACNCCLCEAEKAIADCEANP